ncbi:MAG TPA: 2-dehydropantoate 2-reductase [Streptomyces sp.]|nr:2-dehydropantoate 2-reductase [Streptomyces sp.]
MIPHQNGRRPAPEPGPRAYTVVGGGAIGGTLAFHLARAGHPVHIVDADPDHVAALNTDGLTVVGPDGEHTVPVRAATPDHATGPFRRVLLCVKAQATESAARSIAPRLAPDGFVVSVQNGLNEARIAEIVGEDRTVGAFVNLFADVLGPGRVQDGGAGALVVGETDGTSSVRVAEVVADLQAWGPAQATGNLPGYLWSKLGFGAMLTTTALADAPMARLLDAHRPLMHAVAAEVFAVATALGVTLEPFDAFTPHAYLPGGDTLVREAATDRLTHWLSGQAKDRSGIWRDIAVRKRPTEVPHHYCPVIELADAREVPVPLLRAVLDRLARVEDGSAPMTEAHLTELGSLAAGTGAAR